MKYISTRLNSKELNFQETILQGLADDGGLYVPEFLPNFNEKKLEELKNLSYQELFFEITKEFIGGEISDANYKRIIDKSYQSFNHRAIAPTKQLDKNEFLLELFHGPTLAFKDFALQFLGNLLDYFLTKSGEEIVIIGATSGDTGSAAIQGCLKCNNAQIFILHPHEKISDIQRKQMTTILSDNVFNIAVKSNFDDCQAYVKKMFRNQDFLNKKRMVAVNSINWARIMAQIVYYFYCGLRLGANKNRPVSFTVPTGNFGDIYAGFLAKKMGLAVKKLIVATNSNDILTRFINKNDYSKGEMVETISPSMNIQVSSNFERMLFDTHKELGHEKKLNQLMTEFEKNHRLKVDAKILEKIQESFESYSVNDQETLEAIIDFYNNTGELLDPHTAIGTLASQKFIKSDNYQGEYVVTLATAHPAKFPDSVTKSGAPKPNLPLFLQDLPKKQEKYEILENDIGIIKNFISKNL